MAKTPYIVNDFSGGVNGFIDSQNILDNELAKCQGFKADPGVVSVLGDMKGAYTIGSGDTTASGTTLDIEAGYGLFTFSHDYNMAGGATDLSTNVALASTDYFIMMNRSSGDSHNKFDVYETTAHTWRTDMIDLGGSSSNARVASLKPCFFIVDGAVRISPGNFASADSAEDSDSGSGTMAANTTYGGVNTLTLTTDGVEYLATGDTIIVSGMECVVLAGDATTYYVGRNMTGLFPAVTANSAAVYVMPDTRWRGLVNRKSFSGLTTVGTFHEWYSTYQHPRPPVTWSDNIDDAHAVAFPFTVAMFDGATNATIDGTNSPCLMVGYENAGGTDNTDATWAGASITLYVTALYDDNKQESQPYKGDTFTVASAKELAIWIGAAYADSVVDSGKYLFNRRVTGARLYYEDASNDPGVLFQLLEIDLEKGCKKAGAESYSDWVVSEANEVASCPNADAYAHNIRTTASGDAFIFALPPKALTYEINTGYSVDTNTHARYKTAVVANRRLFVGNVYQGGVARGDRMLSSPPNKFDILPETSFIDVAVGDGDEIVKLESFADRLLQFKKRNLYIINVGGELGTEFLESHHKNMGVENPSQTCSTEYGIAWVNAQGVFLYDGQAITDLTRNKLKISSSTRQIALNVTESNVPTIGYHPTNKWLIIHPQATTTDANDVEAWVFDFKNNSWVYSQELTITDDLKTNMIWTGDNELVFAGAVDGANPAFYKYQDSTSCSHAAFGVATKLLLLTKDFNLGTPGVKKKLRSVYVTYSAAADSYIEADIIYKHPTGSTTDDLAEADSGTTYYTEALGFKSTSGNIRTVELTPTTYVTNAYSFQLKLHNPDAAYPEGADFKLYSIQFVYRPLGVK